MTPHQNTNLPQYYAVKVDLDHPKVEEFRRRINAMYHTNLAIRLKYYGYRDGRYFNCWHNTPRNTPILTIDEWLEAVEPKSKVGNYYQPLFNHMTEQHGLTLLQTEMDEIIRVVNSMNPHSGIAPDELPTEPITKPEPSRLEVAAMILTLFIQNSTNHDTRQSIAEEALLYADELIKQSKL